MGKNAWLLVDDAQTTVSQQDFHRGRCEPVPVGAIEQAILLIDKLAQAEAGLQAAVLSIGNPSTNATAWRQAIAHQPQHAPGIPQMFQAVAEDSTVHPPLLRLGRNVQQFLHIAHTHLLTVLSGRFCVGGLQLNAHPWASG